VSQQSVSQQAQAVIGHPRDLREFLDADDIERAAVGAAAWIKALRLLTVDGVPLRDRFTYRGDSLWWFAELYLHKQGVIDQLWRTALALEALCRWRQQQPQLQQPQLQQPPPQQSQQRQQSQQSASASASLVIAEGNPMIDLLAPQVAQRFGLRIEVRATQSARGAARESRSRLALDLKSRFYTWSALASRLRTGRGTTVPQRGSGASGSGASGSDSSGSGSSGSSSGSSNGSAAGAGGTLAFVHSAFWRKPANSAAAGARGGAGAGGGAGGGAGADADADEGQEGYIGAVLQALQARAEAQPVRLIGVGPRTNFKARRWWHAIVPSRTGVGEIPVEPIEQFASWQALAGSRAVWGERFAMERALLQSEAIRAHATILGYDVWPIVSAELRGVARLQFPWSARAMDEAAAAMDAARPALVVTYAEAGGWGRALMLEARRRGIPSVGLQHGFIYRHWLNYQHEADEMQPSRASAERAAADRGFPRPDLTLVYDGYAANHLITAGHFPPEAIRVTGSPALDALVAAVSRVDDAERARIRAQLADSPGEHLIVLVTKFTQVREALPGLLDAVSTLENVRLVIKPHPAETAEPYLAAAAAAIPARARVTVAPASLDLARLLSVADLLVTVNSTVAIDAIALGLPALVLALPNNLSPFVDAGVMAGVTASGSDPANGSDPASPATLAATIQSLTTDPAARAALLTRARAFAAQHAMRPDGRAAARAAEAMVGIMAVSRGSRAS
jgi:hypothetical protein